MVLIFFVECKNTGVSYISYEIVPSNQSKDGLYVSLKKY